MSARAPRITRRRMVAVSSATVGAPLVLAACGATDELEERSEGKDVDVLNAVLAQHLAVEAATAAFNRTVERSSLVAAEALGTARTESIELLESYIAERGGEATTEPADTAQAENPVEGLVLQLEGSIETSLDAIGGLSSASYRQAVHRFITEDAAALAAMRSVLGGEIAPDAFVFGAPAVQGDGG